MISLIVASVAVLSAQVSDRNLAAAIDQQASSYSRQNTFSGVVIALKGDKTIFRKAFGYASVELGVKASFDSSFNIASVTKPMTIAMAIQLLADNKWDMADRLSRYIAEFPRSDEITIMQLLNHRAGIPHRVTTGDDEAKPQTAETMVQLAAKSKLMFEPGERSSYSSAGFSVLARVLEIIDKKAYGQMLKDRIFTPAGMKTAQNCDPYSVIKNRVSSYSRGRDGYIPADVGDLSFLVGAGSVFCTADDLVKFAQAVFGGKLGASVKANLQRGVHTYWNGLTNGYRCSVDIDTKSDTILVICSNVVTGAVDEIRNAFDLVSKGQPAPEPYVANLPEYPTSDKQLRAFEGQYKMENSDTVLPARCLNGVLMMGNAPLIPVGKDKFFAYRDFGTIEATRDSLGSVTSMTWSPRLGGAHILMTRMRPESLRSFDQACRSVADLFGQLLVHVAEEDLPIGGVASFVDVQGAGGKVGVVP